MEAKTKTLIAILTAVIILLIPIVVMATDPPAPVAKTGQTTSYLTGDDGDLQKGVSSPSPRFIDNGDGTVTDNLTGLMWAKDTNPDVPDFKIPSWSYAIEYANNLSLGSNGCGASYTDWRLPNVRELQSLIDFSNSDPALPIGHPFTNVQSNFYWSSTTYIYPFMISARCVNMSNGNVDVDDKGYSHYIWPVRSLH